MENAPRVWLSIILYGSWADDSKGNLYNLIAKVEQEIIPIRVLMKKDCYHPNWNHLEILFVQSDTSDTSSFFQDRANNLGQNNLPG
jgi:hypothetical protein